MYGDLIAPELARIETIVREARRGAVVGSGRSLLGWGSALTFGIYSGFLPSELREAAELFGATGLLKEVISQLATLKDADVAARQESYYFLWRATPTTTVKPITPRLMSGWARFTKPHILSRTAGLRE